MAKSSERERQRLLRIQRIENERKAREAELKRARKAAIAAGTAQHQRRLDLRGRQPNRVDRRR